MKYEIIFSPSFKKQLKKTKKKNNILFIRLTKKIKEISINPEHYKPLKNELRGKRRAHLDPFVIVFEIKKDLIIIHYVKHHDEAY